MAHELKVDELNIVKRAIPYDRYFGEMILSEKQKQERIDLAKAFEDMMLYLFSLIDTARQYNIDKQFIVDSVKYRYLSILGTVVVIDGYLTEYINQFAIQTVDTTQDNIEDEWYLSSDRTEYIAENEANTSLNYSDYASAIKAGKTRKRWRTMEDTKVRRTHRELNNKTIPIDGIFLVGNSEMRFAKDTSLGASAKEIVNCRCSTEYL